MSWQSETDAWLLKQGVATHRPCPGCNQAIRPGEPTMSCKDGTLYHRLCFDICVASLAAELEVVVREDGWTMRVAEDGRELWTPPNEEEA